MTSTETAHSPHHSESARISNVKRHWVYLPRLIVNLGGTIIYIYCTFRQVLQLQRANPLIQYHFLHLVYCYRWKWSGMRETTAILNVNNNINTCSTWFKGRPLYNCWRNEDQHEVGNQDYSKQNQHLYTETAAAKVDSQGQGVDIANREWCTGRVKNMSENESQRKAQQ